MRGALAVPLTGSPKTSSSGPDRPHSVRGTARLAALLFSGALLLAGCVIVSLVFRLQQVACEAAGDSRASWLSCALPTLLAAVCLLGGLRWTVLLTMSFAAYRRGLHPTAAEPAAWPLVSIFVPAYNEAENIEAALQALLTLDYPQYEVLVIDDGSADETFARARRFAGTHGGCTIRVYRKPNGGKWSAHNFAFRRSRGELVLCLDADSRIDPGSLRRMVRHMGDPHVAAVAGQIRVRNRVNLLTCLQAMEYLLGNGCARMAMSFNGTVLIVAGPLGLFRRHILEEVFLRYGRARRSLTKGQVEGPFEGDTFAEDFDLSLAILSLGGRILYEPTAVSHTRAPDWTFALLSQRYRWCRGTIQVLRKYFRRAWSHPDVRPTRLLAWVATTYLFDLLVLPMYYLCGLAALVLLLNNQVGGTIVLGWAVAALLANLNAAALFALAQGDSLKLLPILPLYDIYQNFLVTPAWFISVFDEVRGVSMRW